MRENVGRVDAWLRVAAGSALALAGIRSLRQESRAPALLLTVGVLMLDTAITRVCPLNALLGIDTRAWDQRLHWGEPGELTGRPQLFADEGAMAIQRPPADS